MLLPLTSMVSPLSSRRIAASGGSTPTATLVANGVSSGATSSSYNTTGANLIVVSVSSQAGAQTLSDSKGNTWIPLTSQASTSQLQLYYCISPTVGTGHTFTVAGNTLVSIAVQAWNTSPVRVFDTSTGAANGGATSLHPGSITPPANYCLLVTGCVYYQVSGTVSIDSGFTISDQLNGASGLNYGNAMAYLFQASAAAVNPQWTTSSIFSGVNVSMASFKF